MSRLYIISEYLSKEDIEDMQRALVRILQDDSMSPTMFGELSSIEVHNHNLRTCDLCGGSTSDVVIAYFDGKYQYPFPWAVTVCRDREPCRLRAATRTR